MGAKNTKTQNKVLIVGLDNSGKTTLINLLKPAEHRIENITPTVGYSIEKFCYKDVNMVAFDMSGSGRYRNFWKTYRVLVMLWARW